MTVLKEIKLNHRRHPRDGGDPLRSGCFLRLNIKNYECMKQWIPSCAGMTNKQLYYCPTKWASTTNN